MKQKKIHKFGGFKKMWKETPVFLEDLEQLTVCKFIPWEKLNGKTIFITGGTGLIGYTLISALLYYDQKYNAGLNIIVLVRDLEQAKDKFSRQFADQCRLTFIQGSIEEIPDINIEIDYIIHGASPTASTFFVQKPAETIAAIVTGTYNMLELARKKKVSGFVYLSSMEVFGEIHSKEKLSEENLGYIDIFSPRSSYPESKRLAENMCCAFSSEYQVPVTTARLAQTFGPGVTKEDQRVFAYIAHCAINGEDICLKTSGAKENMYLYTMDAVSAILLLLIKGSRGETFNVGNSKTYCSVKEMAQLAAQKLSKKQISVMINMGETTEILYRPESYLNMDTAKLQSLGWSAKYDLLKMYERMIACF